VPGIRPGAVKMPALLVVSERIVPCKSLEMTTLAFGTVAPDGSFTSPEMPATPPATCARADAAAKQKNAAVILTNLPFFNRID
jgi:hypothetical protein